MAATQGTLLLSELDPTKRRVTVHAGVARMWDFLGRNNELAHVDIVLIDAKGNTMYAEIGPGHANKYKGLIKEGGVYLLKDFFVDQAKNKFKAVPGRFMKKVTPWTKAEPISNVPDDFPLYAYSLTAFDKLPGLVGAKDSFIDVMGIITAISELLRVRLPGQAVDSYKRTLHLVDIELGKQLPAVRWLKTEDDHYYNPTPAPEPENVEIKDLLATDPNEYLGLKMVCTVTIMKLKSNSWWFMACSRCHKSAYAVEDTFVCSDDNCSSSQAEPRYKIRVIGSDGTGDIELIFFATVAEHLIGKKADTLARAAARKGNAVPAEVSALVIQKYTLNISVSQRGLSYGELAFQVNSINAVHRKGRVFQFTALASSSGQKNADEATAGSSDRLPLPDKDAIESLAKLTDGTENKDEEPPFPASPDNVQAYSPTENASDSFATPPPVTPECSSVKPKQTKKRSGTETVRPSAAKQLFKKSEND